MGSLAPPTWSQLVSVQLKIASSCAWVRLAGAAVLTAGTDQVTASPAMAVNAIPPAAYAGSVELRTREDRAKLVHSGPLLLVVNMPSWRMPCEDPSGRPML